jgi:dTDP-4-dehydrorhamnose reductase
MLGHDVTAAAQRADHKVVGLAHRELDIADSVAVAQTVARTHPDVVINCAAYTDVDGAESESQRAHQINGTGAGHVARAAARAGAWTIHISSDYVFDGTKHEPYVETDRPAPRSQYGASKLAGERAAAQSAPNAHTIVRTAWLFGAHGPCFPATILRLADERDELSVVDDQVGCPTFTGHLAEALLSLADARPPGIVHVAAAGACSWFDFATELVSAAGKACTVKPGRTEDLGRPAPRPAYSVLGSERPKDAPKLAPWQVGLADYLAVGVSVR